MLEIVDTAVKIGLGALISGVLALILSKQQHKHDHAARFATKRVQLIEESTLSITKYIDALGNYISAIEGLVRTDIQEDNLSDENLEELGILDEDISLVEERTAVQEADARLRMIGETDAAASIKVLCDVENRIRDRVIFDRTLPKAEELSEISLEFKDAKDTVYKKLNGAFKSSFKAI